MSLETVNWEGAVLGGGRYQVGKALGEGGMGFVYRARQLTLDTDVVIKVPRPALLADPEFKGRFTREIRSLVLLEHPHVVRALDVGEHEGLPYAVLQFLSGGNLRDKQPTDSRGMRVPLPVHTLAEPLTQIASALDFIHGRGYVHRDLKPENVFFDSVGHAFLGDFGIAKALDKGPAKEPQPGQPQTVMTEAGLVLGTPAYMAPELILGEDYDGRADQYALAVMVFELLTGCYPFRANTSAALFMQHATHQPPLLHEANPTLPKALSAVVARGLAKDPKERFPDCTSFLRDLLGKADAPAPSGRSGVQPVPPAKPGTGTDRNKVARGACPRCGKAVPLPSEPGQRITCPHCGAGFRVKGARPQGTQALSRPATEQPTPETKASSARGATTPPPLPHLPPNKGEELPETAPYTGSRSDDLVFDAPTDVIAVEEGQQKGGSPVLMIAGIAAALLLVLGAGGGVGAWWFFFRTADDSPSLVLPLIVTVTDAVEMEAGQDAEVVVNVSGGSVTETPRLKWANLPGVTIKPKGDPEGMKSTFTFAADRGAVGAASEQVETDAVLEVTDGEQTVEKKVRVTILAIPDLKLEAGNGLTITPGKSASLPVTIRRTRCPGRVAVRLNDKTGQLQAGALVLTDGETKGTLEVKARYDLPGGSPVTVEVTAQSSRLRADGSVSIAIAKNPIPPGIRLEVKTPTLMPGIPGSLKVQVERWLCKGDVQIDLKGASVADGISQVLKGGKTEATFPLRARANLVGGTSLTIRVVAKLDSYQAERTVSVPIAKFQPRTTFFAGAKAPHRDTVRSLVVGGDRLIHSWDAQGRFIRWDVSTGNGIEDPPPIPGECAAATALGGKIVVGKKDGTLAFLPATRKEDRLFLAQNSPVLCVAFSPDGARFGSGAEDGSVEVWNRPRNRLASIKADKAVRCLALGRSGEVVVTGDDGGNVILWQIRDVPGKPPVVNQTPLGKMDKAVSAVALSSSGRVLAGGVDGALWLWDTGKTTPHKLTPHASAVRSVAFSPDGKQAGSGDAGGLIRVWDTDTRTELRVLAEHRGPVEVLVFFSDGMRVVSAGEDRIIRLWDVP